VLRRNGGDTLYAGYPSDYHSCYRVSFAFCACANICQPEQPSVEGEWGGDTLYIGYPPDHHSCSRESFAVCACANICQPEQPSVKGEWG
jgi:hypothetical protein